jgi:biopolymer transport protein ExbB
MAVIALGGCRQIAGVDDYRFAGAGGAGGGGASSTSNGATVASSSVASSASSTSSGPVTPWTRRRALTLQTGVGEALTDFPVLIALSAARIDYAQTKDAGQDLRFTSSDGATILAHEIESWDEGGTSIVWVKIPALSALGKGETVMMYYGNEGASDGQSVAAVWSPHFRGVWHLSAGDDTLPDSSQTNVSAQNSGAMPAPGRVGLGRQFNAKMGTYIDTNHAEDLATFTIEVWVKGDTAPSGAFNSNGPLMREKNYQIAWSYPDADLVGAASFMQKSGQGGDWVAAKFGTLEQGQWVHVAATYDGSTLRAFKNGELKDQTAAGPPESETATAKIGRDTVSSAENNFFNGTIDEVRISSVARSPAWLDAQHRSMTDANFVSYGPEESGSWSLP